MVGRSVDRVARQREEENYYPLDALEEIVPPERIISKPLRTPISGIYHKEAGDIFTGRVEQGVVKCGDEVLFLPTHTPLLPCTGKISSIEMHHISQPSASAGDIVGFNIQDLPKDNMPRVGDIMILKTDTSLRKCKEFTCKVEVLNGEELKPGYSPIAIVRTARSIVQMVKINWKVFKDKKTIDPFNIQAQEIAEVVFVPQQPFTVDSFKSCEGLGRVLILEGHTVVMLGEITKVIFADDNTVPPMGALARCISAMDYSFQKKHSVETFSYNIESGVWKRRAPQKAGGECIVKEESFVCEVPLGS